MTQDELERMTYYDSIPVHDLLVPELEDYLQLMQKRITELQTQYADATP